MNESRGLNLGMNGVVGATKKDVGTAVFAVFLTRETRGLGAAAPFLGIVDHSNTIFIGQVVEKRVEVSPRQENEKSGRGFCRCGESAVCRF